MRELHLVLPDPLRWRLPVAAACLLSGLPIYYSALPWLLKSLAALLLLWLALRFDRLLRQQRQWSAVWLLAERQVRLIHIDGGSYQGQLAFSRLLFSRVLVLALHWPTKTHNGKTPRHRLPVRLWISLPALSPDQSRRLRVWHNLYGLGDPADAH